MPTLVNASIIPPTLASSPIAGGGWGGMLMALGVLLITACVVASLRKRMKERTTTDAPPRAPESPRRSAPARTTRDRQAQRSLEELMVEAEELVRRLAAHLDNKAARLEKLMREADETIQRIDSESSGTIESRSVRSDFLHPNRSIDPLSEDVYRLSDEGLAPIEIAQRLSEGVGKVELILALREN